MTLHIYQPSHNINQCMFHIPDNIHTEDLLSTFTHPLHINNIPCKTHASPTTHPPQQVLSTLHPLSYHVHFYLFRFTFHVMPHPVIGMICSNSSPLRHHYSVLVMTCQH